MPDVISFGELLIDFVPTVSNVTLIEAPAFKKAPGGAPANVAVGLARLGISTGFMGKVGDDPFGHFLAKVLAENRVDISAMKFSSEARTALAFVSLTADGEREFMFYRHPSADMLYSPDEIDSEYILKAKLFHFGSITLISEPSKSATLRALEVARQGHLLISYDPNLRLNLWPGESTAKEGILSVWEEANFIKVSEEEIRFLSGKSDIVAGAKSLWHPNLYLLVVTKGGEGCTFISQEFSGNVPGYTVEPVDTTGAGDGFVAGFIYGLIENPHCWRDKKLLTEVCRFANGVGALTTMERGAIPALPTKEQVLSFMHM
jgi:fructokinase